MTTTVYYRIKLATGKYLGGEYPNELRPVLEPLAECFTSPGAAAKAALMRNYDAADFDIERSTSEPTIWVPVDPDCYHRPRPLPIEIEVPVGVDPEMALSYRRGEIASWSRR